MLFEPLLHYAHPPGRILLRPCECDVGRAVEPRVEFFLARKQDGHSVVIDGRYQFIRRGGEKRETARSIFGPSFLTGPLVAAPNPGEGEHRTLIFPKQRKPECQVDGLTSPFGFAK